MPHHDSPLKRIHWHPFRNAGSETIPAFGVMRITGVEERHGVAVYTVDKPSTTFQRLYLINGPKQVAAGGYGSGTFDVTYALCSSSASPAYGESWGAKHSEWKLFQHRPGFFILGGYTGDGAAQRALVRQEEVKEVWGQLASSLSNGGSSSLIIQTRDGASWTSSGFDMLTVYDRLLPGGAGGSVGSGRYAVADWWGDRWWISSAQCPDT